MDRVGGLPVSLLHELENARVYSIPEQPLKDASTLMTSFSISRNVLDSWNTSFNQTKCPPIPYSISLRDGTLERVCGLTGLCKCVSV